MFRIRSSLIVARRRTVSLVPPVRPLLAPIHRVPTLRFSNVASSSTPPNQTKGLSGKQTKNVLSAGQIARKASKVPAVNVAASITFPSPSEHTAPFPHQPDANDKRAWRPSEAQPPCATDAALLTTPIYYANGSAHIGHLSTTLLLDALNRWKSISSSSPSNGRASWLTSGTDEHGSKVAESAGKIQLHPSEHVRRISHSFHELFKRAHIHIDDYVRTTERRHFATAQAVWEQLHAKGYIYLGQHRGYYSRVEECFITDSQVEERTIPASETTPATTAFFDRESGHRVEYLTEKNYKFRLSAFQQVLIDWIEAASASPHSVIEPPSRRNEILLSLKSIPLEDISVSRLKSKVSWGIPLPAPINSNALNVDPSMTASDELTESPEEHASHVMYVWLDALTNYLTVAGISPEQIRDLSKLSTNSPLWPPTVQLIGKDILRFHTIYWVSFLVGLNLPPWHLVQKDSNGQIVLSQPAASFPLSPPRQVIAHAHWLADRTKMSKSLGNVVDPNTLIDDFGVDPVRFFILRDAQLADDSNFAASDVIKRLHSDLADTFGNLLNRCIGPALLPENALPNLEPEMMKSEPFAANEVELIQELNQLPTRIQPSMEALKFGEAIATIFSYLWRVNAYVNLVTPWAVRKEVKRLSELSDPSDADRQQLRQLSHTLAKTLYLCLESVRCVGILLQPIMPDSMNKLLWRLAVPNNERLIKHAQ